MAVPGQAVTPLASTMPNSATVRLLARNRPRLVLLHEPAEPDHVGREDRSKLAGDLLLRHVASPTGGAKSIYDNVKLVRRLILRLVGRRGIASQPLNVR